MSSSNSNARSNSRNSGNRLSRQNSRSKSRVSKSSSSVSSRPIGLHSNGNVCSKVERREVWKQHRAHDWQSEHRDWQQRGGYKGYRIPEDRYRVHFGPNHWFRIHRYPMEMYGGYPRFQYGGFWFGFMEPWPEYWSDDWYDNDDVYVAYSGDGYYLYNRRHPRDRIAISVYVN